MSLVLALSDSLLSAHSSFGMHQLQLQDEGDRFHVCLCVASGCSLMLPWDCRASNPMSAISIAVRTLESSNPSIDRYLADNPRVRVVVLNSRSSISLCRKTGEEEFPHLVQHRRRSPLVSGFETPWTICDLEDVITQREGRERFDELELCKLRNKKGIFSKTDYYHLRRDIGKKAVAEIIKAARRTVLTRHVGNSNGRVQRRRKGCSCLPRKARGSLCGFQSSDDTDVVPYSDCPMNAHEGSKGNDIILVLAAGWNADDRTYAKLDSFGKAWLRADIVASAELCALDGHPISAFMKKMRELAGRMRGTHQSFLRQSIGSIRALRPPNYLRQVTMRKRTRGNAFGLGGSKRRKVDDVDKFPFAGKYVGDWYGKDQEVVIYRDWTYTVPGHVDHGRVTRIVPRNSTVYNSTIYRLTRSDKSGGKCHYFRFLGSKAFGAYAKKAYKSSSMPLESNALWTLLKD